ncbi:MAG TPA: urease accessory UreF family protein [Dongiaceae bacterium]|nr:urease accessory UreF family protein [Dongiaceae bacterium]
MTEPFDEAALRRLLTWLSPAYPVGAFSYSHGLEWSVECGDVTNRDSLADWIDAILRHGSGRMDGILLAHAWRALTGADDAKLREVAELALAIAPSSERYLETTAQGTAFLATTRAVWPASALDHAATISPDEVAYPVAVGVAAAAHGIALGATLNAYLLSFATNLVSAGVRLIPLGQTDGLRTLAALEAAIAAVARAASDLPLEELGGATIRADIAAMKHETQYTRLFRT